MTWLIILYTPKNSELSHITKYTFWSLPGFLKTISRLRSFELLHILYREFILCKYISCKLTYTNIFLGTSTFQRIYSKTTNYFFLSIKLHSYEQKIVTIFKVPDLFNFQFDDIFVKEVREFSTFNWYSYKKWFKAKDKHN